MCSCPSYTVDRDVIQHHPASTSLHQYNTSYHHHLNPSIPLTLPALQHSQLPNAVPSTFGNSTSYHQKHRLLSSCWRTPYANARHQRHDDMVSECRHASGGVGLLCRGWLLPDKVCGHCDEGHDAAGRVARLFVSLSLLGSCQQVRIPFLPHSLFGHLVPTRTVTFLTCHISVCSSS